MGERHSDTAYKADTFYASGLDAEIARLRAQVELTWHREAALLRRLGLRDDAAVLELGSGPGFVTEKLCGLVSRGSVTAVEIDPTLVERAGRYLQTQGRSRYHLVQANVTKLDLPSESFDVAIARYVLLHLAEPISAAREALRLLKPGGLLLTLDLDVPLSYCEPSFPEFDMLGAAATKLFALRGADAHFGRRKQRRLLESAGFQEIDVDTIAVDSDETGSFEPFLSSSFSADIVGRAAVAAGIWSPQELDAYREGLTRFCASGEGLVVQVRPVAWGRKALRK
jgi:ubiquinone/menaquinone biosynthesis C-methylase UbiE